VQRTGCHSSQDQSDLRTESERLFTLDEHATDTNILGLSLEGHAIRLDAGDLKVDRNAMVLALLTHDALLRPPAL
jgi:hypothetical protein